MTSEKDSHNQIPLPERQRMNPSSPRLRRTGKTILLFTLTCLSTFNGMHSTIQKLDFTQKFEFLNDRENQIYRNAIKQIKWRIGTGYLAELNDDLEAVRWLVKRVAARFVVKTTTVAAQIGTRAAIRYFDMANQFLEILVTHGEKEARKYQYVLYPEYDADRYRMDNVY